VAVTGSICSQQVATLFPPPHPITIRELRSVTEILSLNWSRLRNYCSACTSTAWFFSFACGLVYLITCSENSDKTHLCRSLNKWGQPFSDIAEHIHAASHARDAVASSSRGSSNNTCLCSRSSFWRVFGAAISPVAPGTEAVCFQLQGMSLGLASPSSSALDSCMGGVRRGIFCATLLRE